jgi:hypothetical protein
MAVINAFAQDAVDRAISYRGRTPARIVAVQPRSVAQLDRTAGPPPERDWAADGRHDELDRRLAGAADSAASVARSAATGSSIRVAVPAELRPAVADLADLAESGRCPGDLLAERADGAAEYTAGTFRQAC